MLSVKQSKKLNLCCLRVFQNGDTKNEQNQVKLIWKKNPTILNLTEVSIPSCEPSHRLPSQSPFNSISMNSIFLWSIEISLVLCNIEFTSLQIYQNFKTTFSSDGCNLSCFPLYTLELGVCLEIEIEDHNASSCSRFHSESCEYC